MRGTFRAVGTFETSGPNVPAIAVTALAVIAAVSWVATFLLVLALIAAVVIVIAIAVIAAFWLLRPHSDRDAELLAERTAGLNAEVAAKAAPRAVENHYHLHLPPGTDARGIDWAALPARDAAETREN